MDLIVWRHAEAFEAEPGEDDMNRVLTSRGKKQAERMAVWLSKQSEHWGANTKCVMLCHRVLQWPMFWRQPVGLMPNTPCWWWAINPHWGR